MLASVRIASVLCVDTPFYPCIIHIMNYLVVRKIHPLHNFAFKSSLRLRRRRRQHRCCLLLEKSAGPYSCLDAEKRYGYLSDCPFLVS